MKQERSIVVIGAEQGHIPVIIQNTVARGFVTGIPVVVEILGVSQDDILAHERKSFVEHLLHPGQFTGVKDVRWVHGDFQVRGADLIQKAPGFPRRINDVVHFGLEREHHVRLPGDAGRLPHTSRHVPPRFRRIVIGMPSPHVVRVTSAGAHMNKRCPHFRARLGQNSQPPQSGLSLLCIRVGHVERTRDTRNPDPASRRFPPDPRRQFRRDLIGHFGQTGACHTHLNTREPKRLGLIQPRFERARRERGGEQDADLRGLTLGSKTASAPERDGPGQVNEITPAAVLSSHGLGIRIRSFHLELQVAFSVHPIRTAEP